MDDVRRPSVAFIAVGSNIEPQRHIVAALERLQERARVTGSSTFYGTRPIGRPGQPWFVNGVWRIDTAMNPMQIRCDLLAPTEEALGRRRCSDRFAPRTIDLDLVLYDDLVVDDSSLCLPHPDLLRPFVCAPVRELLDAAGDVEPGLRGRMLRILPAPTAKAEPGEPLHELTEQLRQMLGASQ